MQEEQELIPQTEDDADALLEGIEAPSGDSSMEAAPTAEQTQQAIDFAFTVGGKEIKLDLAKDRDKLMRWAQQGYEAPNKIGELNKKLEGYTQRETQYKEWQEKYGPVDDYVRQNPQFWDHVVKQYQQQQQQVQNGQQEQVSPAIQQLMQEVQGLKQIASTYQQQEQERQAMRDDALYMDEFSKVQKQYPKIDFSTPDQEGKNLEYKVLEFAQAKGIKEFTTAFKAFHHDELLKLAQEEAKEKLISDRQSKSKLGILNVSSTPTRKTSDSVKGKNYNDLAAEALQELGLT